MARNHTDEANAARRALVQSMMAQGRSQKYIAATLGIASSSLREWMSRQGLKRQARAKAIKKAPRRPDIEAMKAAPTMPRTCACGTQFLSRRAEGAWLRMCEPCRSRPISPYAPGAAGHTGRRVGVFRSPAG